MEYLNLHTSDLDSDAFLGAEPVDRATWLCLMRYCIGQENSGRIRDCRAWKDRKWQQIVRVTEEEVRGKCDLWEWVGDDLVVRFYPIKSEEKLRSCRENGSKGGRPTKPRGNPIETQPETQEEPSHNHKEKKRKEKERKEREIERESAGAREDSANSEKISRAATQLLTACGFKTEWHLIPEEPRNAILSAVPLLMDGEALGLICRHVPAWITDRQTSKNRFQPEVTVNEVAKNLTNIYEYASKREQPEKDKYANGF